jgi:formate hydrogenlyase transcriptional activator
MQPEQPLPARYEALIRVSQAIRAHRDCEALFRSLARELRNVVSFDYVAVVLYDPAAHAMRLHLLDASDPDRELPQPEVGTEELFAWWVYEHQQPLVIPSLEKETRFPQLVKFLTAHGFQSTCAVPLTTAHRRLGALGFGSKHEAAHSGEEVHILCRVADVVALAIDDVMNLEASRRAQAEVLAKREELQRERDRLALLLDINNKLVAHLELRDLLRAVSASVRETMRCDAVGVVLPDVKSGQLRIYALDFPSGKGALTEEIVIPTEGSVSGAVLRSGKPMQAGPPYPAEMNALYQRLIVSEGIRSLWLLPLSGRQGPLGVLGVGRLQENAFSQEDVDSLMQVASQAAIALDNALAYGQIKELKDKLAQEKLYLEDEIRSEMNFDQIVGLSAVLRRTLKQVETVAPTESTVLILGETGTGKELIARAVHDLSPRKPSPFVKLNCAAIPTGLLESELFGHEKGAFTGAITQRIGRFELASRGTVFLDEVGEIPLELQPKLLRVLQEREFERLGNSRTLHTDARLIAATNRDLSALVDEQKFRPDLFYRLNVFPIRVPPLRERAEDIPLMVRHFTQEFARRMSKTIETIPSETMHALCDYHWPGNIRELQNVIERAVILTRGSVLQIPVSELKNAPAAIPASGTRSYSEREQILRMLGESKGRVGGADGAAARMGLKRTTLISRMKKLGIDPREVS